jgi:hypothetical protein
MLGGWRKAQGARRKANFKLLRISKLSRRNLSVVSGPLSVAAWLQRTRFKHFQIRNRKSSDFTPEFWILTPGFLLYALGLVPCALCLEPFRFKLSMSQK